MRICKSYLGISLLVGVLVLGLSGGLVCSVAAQEADGQTDEGPLPVVAIGSPLCLLTVEITGGTPQSSVTEAMALEGFYERLSQALVCSGSVQLLERQNQDLMNREIAERVGRGEDPSTVIKDVGRKYRVNEYLSTTTLEFHCEYEPGFLTLGRCSKGSARAVVSLIPVAEGTTRDKPEARVPYLKVSGAQPPAWFSEVQRLLANEIVRQGYRVVPPRVFRVNRPDCTVLIDRGESAGVYRGRRFVLRDPAEKTERGTLRGKAIGEITVTDRVDRDVAECGVSKVIKQITDRTGKSRQMTVDELIGYIAELLDKNTPPEATDQ